MNQNESLLFIGYPKCSTSNKAQKWLDKHGTPYTFRHIKEETPTVDELKLWHQRTNLPLRRMFNTSGMLYKELNLKDKLPTLTDEEQFQLLASDGMLIKRPMLVSNSFVLLGFKEKDWSDKLL